ncbi:MAG: 3-hydroxyacyl-CoA dehydrogenase family protein [Pseudomonadales bacterium]|jgi:3-hydroxybutyryl-CoA dehydrogenase|nr:3-hydroxyacyl-CoA dehydrogenase family protein [Pseudomonadales bacterium]MDP4753031.1 3-hydroxyacyl-CoA dehydrogenase family protein [Porticoccaceae bacterium]MDP5051148.1 3-hydroxyacyl-CoA dehydrogenase family protein [Porticoccaceae bacterium]
MQVKNIAVVGGGTMGIGIAYVSALSGAEVILVEPSDRQAKVVSDNIASAAAGGVARNKFSRADADALIGRIRRLSDVDAIPEHLDLIIETVPEQLALKQKVLAQIDTRKPALIGTNTSACSIDTLAESVSAPENFFGLHFFNPVWSIKLVEIIKGQATSAASLDQAREFVSQIDKQSLTVSNIPGFATSRLDLIASLEAMRMLESGVASAEDIDRAAVLAYQHPVGPLRLSDIVGLDVRLDIARTLELAHGPRFAPPDILIEMVAKGQLGEKSGQGFFAWQK